MLKREMFDKLPCSGIQFRVTREDPQMAAPPCTTSGATSSDFLSPHTFAARNSLCSVSDYSLRRRRPITLKIMPRLSLPCRSTSAPASTDSDWADLR
ncbi:hypothetical protein Cfor_11552, partial [Coptotermes formosanus]